MELFPHVLVRVSGEAFEELSHLNMKSPVVISKDIYTLKVKLSPLVNNLSNALYDIVPLAPNAKIRRALINLRRDIFNEREITSERVDFVRNSLPPIVVDDLENYLQVKKKLNRLLNQGKVDYSNEIAVVRKHLRKWAINDTLQKGLLLSSQSLLKYGIPNYITKSVDSLGKRELQTEKSIVKYISRICAKTSPFSTFTNLSMGEITTILDNDSVKRPAPLLYTLNGDKPRIISHIRLNNYLYKYLKGLLTKNPNIYRWFRIRPNPTLQKIDDHYLFLTNNNNIEAFQRIQVNPILELLYALVSKKTEGIVYHDLLQALIQGEYIDALPNVIENYINQLIDYGFLEFDLGVSGIDPDWDVKLCENLLQSLAEKEIPLTNELHKALREIRHLANMYGQANIETRQDLLGDAYQSFRTICMDLHEAAGLPATERKSIEEQKPSHKEAEIDKGKNALENNLEDESIPANGVFKHQTSTRFRFRPEQMFYEDTTLTTKPVFAKKAMTQLAEKLHTLLQELSLFESLQDERDEMTHYFINKYSPEATVPLISFYEDYYREFRKPDVEAKNMGDVKKSMAPAVLSRAKKRTAWQTHLWSLLTTNIITPTEQILIRGDHLDVTNEHLNIPAKTQTIPSSYGAFIQPFVLETGTEFTLNAVINGSFAGFGKMTSRFLHLLDKSMMIDTRRWNLALDQEALLIENCDASFMNANLHPSLMPYEIWIPGGNNSLATEAQIPITDLAVKLAVEGDRLQLIHQPTQKKAYLFDLGFQGTQGRSQLFRLLNHFSLTHFLSVAPLVQSIEYRWRQMKTQARETNDNLNLPSIEIIPRIVYEDCLVLQRKTWLIPREHLPLRNPQESDSVYFMRVNQWRLEIGLPENIFVYLFARHQLEDFDETQRTKLKRDDYKPQYISFANPLFVQLFEGLIERVPRQLRVEEMLPAPGHLATLTDRPHVFECVVQWYEGVNGLL